MKGIRQVLVTAALTLGLIFAARAVVIWSPQVGDLNMPGLSPTSLGTYVKNVPSTGFSLTFDNFQTRLLLRPSGTLAAGYITLAPRPFDGAEACVFTTQIITAFYVAAGSGHTINNAFAGTQLDANARTCYVYSLSNTTWDRSE